jgi:hypothetical protein
MFGAVLQINAMVSGRRGESNDGSVARSMELNDRDGSH